MARSISICSINCCGAASIVADAFSTPGAGPDATFPISFGAASLPPANIQLGSLDALPWEDESVDAVICSAVLHFARDEQEFAAAVKDMWRVLAPGGLFFARLATSIGLERQLPAPVGRMRLPDGSERFVVDERTLLDWTSALGGTLADPLKTTNVANARCMTTWVMEK